MFTFNLSYKKKLKYIVTSDQMTIKPLKMLNCSRPPPNEVREQLTHHLNSNKVRCM